MTSSSQIRLLEDRAAELSLWLENEAPYAQFDQHHLDAGTPEQAYWHLGYRSALADLLRLLKGGVGDNDGISNHSPSADPDA